LEGNQSAAAVPVSEKDYFQITIDYIFVDWVNLPMCVTYDQGQFCLTVGKELACGFHVKSAALAYT
jgi:hypothetical protein